MRLQLFPPSREQSFGVRSNFVFGESEYEGFGSEGFSSETRVVEGFPQGNEKKLCNRFGY